MPKNNSFSLTPDGMEKYLLRKYKSKFIYNNMNKETSSVRYSIARLSLETKAKDGKWIEWRPYTIPIPKDGTNTIEEYYQQVMTDLRIDFKELEKTKKLANTEFIVKKLGDACTIADYVLTFLSSFLESITTIKEPTFADIFNRAREEGVKEIKVFSKDTDTIDYTNAEKNIKSFFTDVKKFVPEFGKAKFFNKILEMPGDYFAVERPAWDAAMMKLNEILVEEEVYGNGVNKSFTNKVVNSAKYNALFMFIYRLQIILNTVAAEIMAGFMLKGFEKIEDARNINLKKGIPRICLGIMYIILSKPIADECKEQIEELLEGVYDILKGTHDSVTKSVEDENLVISTELDNALKELLNEFVEIPCDLISGIFERAISQYNLAELFGGVCKLYTCYIEEIKGDNYTFLAVQDLDSPDISFTTPILLKDIGLYFLSKLGGLMRRKKIPGKKMVSSFLPAVGAGSQVGIHLARKKNTLKEYNTQVLDYKGLDTVVAPLENIKALFGYMKGKRNLEFTAIFDIKGEIMDKVEEEVELFTFVDPFDLNMDNRTKPVNASIYKPGSFTLANIAEPKFSYVSYRDNKAEFHLIPMSVIETRPGFSSFELNFKPLREIEGRGYLSDYINKFKDSFKEIYSELDSISLYRLTFRQDVFQSEPDIFKCRYKVYNQNITEVSKKNGFFTSELSKNRLSQKDSILKILTMKEIIKLNPDFSEKIAEDGSFIILQEGIITEEGKLNRDLPDYYDQLKDIKFPEYRPNKDVLYGSGHKKEKPEGKQEKFEFYTRTNHGTYYIKKKREDENCVLSNPDGRILINGKRIGTNLERELAWEGNIDFLQKQQKYREVIDCGNNKVLDLRYTYDFNGGLINLLEKSRYPFLRVKYRLIDKRNKEKRIDNYNLLIIKEFEASKGDYGIEIPNVFVVIPGSKVNYEKEKDERKQDQQDVKIKLHKTNSSQNIGGKLLTQGNPVTTLELDENERETGEYIICVVRGIEDYLGNVAKEWLGSSQRWKELEKEPGICFEDGDQFTLQKGTKIYIPKDKINKYRK